MRKKLEPIDPVTRFYILWRWTYNGQEIEYDDARILSELLPSGDKEKMMIQGLLLKAPVVTGEERQITLERWSG